MYSDRGGGNDFARPRVSLPLFLEEEEYDYVCTLVSRRTAYTAFSENKKKEPLIRCVTDRRGLRALQEGTPMV